MLRRNVKQPVSSLDTTLHTWHGTKLVESANLRVTEGTRRHDLSNDT